MEYKYIHKVLGLAILFLSVFSSALFAQPLHQGEWRTYTSMTTITDIAVVRSSGNVWAVTTGGAFRFTPSANVKDNILALRNSDGLSVNDITAVAADSNGKIYFGGSNGTLDIYTESSGTIKTIRDISLSSQFARRRIYQLANFGARIYIATGYGMSIYDITKNVFTETITKFGGLNEQDTVFGVTEANDSIYVVLSGAVAIAARNAPNLTAPFAWRIVSMQPGGTLNSITSLGGKIIAGGPQGIYTISGNTLAYIPMTPITDSISVVRLVVSGSTLFILDKRGNRLLSTTDLQSFSSSALPGDNTEKNISNFAMGNSNNKIFGYGIGGVVVELASGSVVPKVYPDGPLSNDIRDIHFAGSLGKLFVSLSDAGLSVFEPGKNVWIPWSTRDKILPATSYTSAYYDSVHSKLWLSTGGNALYSVDPNDPSKIRHYGAAEGIPTFNPLPDNFTVMGRGTMDNHGNFIITSWAGSGEGLAKTSDGNTFTPIQLNPPPPSQRPFGVCVQDMDDIYFAGTVSNTNPSPFGVAAVFRDGKTMAIPGGIGEKLGNTNVNAMIVDQDNGLWCGTNVGVDVLTHSRDFQGNYTFRARRLSLTDQQVVRTIAVDGVGNKWVGTDNGVFVLSGDGSDSVAHFTTSNSPLIDNVISNIAIDTRNGEAYISTSKGISRVRSIYQEGASDYSKIYVYPNPVIQNSDDAMQVTITGLAGGSKVKIFTAAGRLVATIDGSKLGSTVVWNGRDDNGKLLASGVYIAAAASPVTSEYGQTKFVLIRK